MKIPITCFIIDKSYFVVFIDSLKVFERFDGAKK